MKAFAAQTRFLLSQYDGLLAGLDDRYLAVEPIPGAKTAGWIVGHLVVTGDFGRRLCGLDPISPKEWRTLFSPGTKPSHDETAYPRMAELVKNVRAVYTDFAQQAPLSTSPRLDEPNPYEPARGAFPTGRDFARYLLTGHLGYHFGQLAICTAVQGRAT